MSASEAGDTDVAIPSEMLEQPQVRLGTAQPIQITGPTLSDVISLYLEHAKTELTEGTFKQRVIYLGKLRQDLGHRVVSDLVPDDLEKWVAEHPKWRSTSTRASVIKICKRALCLGTSQETNHSSDGRGYREFRFGSNEKKVESLMPLTNHQKEIRKQHIGASEVPALLGKQPEGWPNAYDIYLNKIQPPDDSNGSEVQELGNDLEPYIVNKFEKSTGQKIIRNQLRVSAGGILSATHDALLIDKPEGVEAKTCGILFPSNEVDQFGDPGTDEVPDRIILQAQAQCAVSELETVWVPCLIGRRGYLVFQVRRDERLVKIVTDAAEQFWTDHVERQVPPSDVIPSLSTVKSLRRVPQKVVHVPAEIVREWDEHREKRLEAEKSEKKALAALLAQLGDAEAATSEIGMFTYMETSRAAYSVEATTYRTPRLKTSKG